MWTQKLEVKIFLKQLIFVFNNNKFLFLKFQGLVTQIEINFFTLSHSFFVNFENFYPSRFENNEQTKRLKKPFH